jgi:hypothetical protein
MVPRLALRSGISRVGEPGAVSPRIHIVVALVLVAVALVVAGESPPALGAADRALTRLFTPAGAPPGRYVVYRSDRPIAAVAAELKGLDLDGAPGEWEPLRPEAHDAFGQEGPYDRSRLARLFRGRRVTLIRGSLKEDGQRVAYTLISPYPAPTLDDIIDGTMLIRFIVPTPDSATPSCVSRFILIAPHSALKLRPFRALVHRRRGG